MAVLAEGQYELDGTLLLGAGTTIAVQQTSIEPGTPAVQDAQVVMGDGVRMGADILPALALTITGVITAGEGQGAAALDTYEQLAAAWQDEATRAVPGAYQTLRIRYPGSAATRAVIGRGRKIAPTLGMVRHGLVPFVAQFDCASPYFYADADSSLVLGLLPADVSGQGVIHNRYANTAFAGNITGWQAVHGAAAYDAAHYHTAAGSVKITPTGGLTGVYASGDLDNDDLITAGRAYTNALWVLAPSSLSVQVQAAIAWLNSGGAVISTSSGPLATLTAATWTLLSAPGVPPAGTVRADPRLVYAGTPANTDITYLDDVAFTENLGGIAPPVTPPVVLGGTAETASTCANPGRRRAWPVFTIAGPVSYPRITYPAAGPWVQLITSVPAGMTATIDTRPWQRSVLRSDGASLAGYLRGNPLRDLAFPAGATTSVRFSGQDPTGAARLSVTWRPVTGSIGGST